MFSIPLPGVHGLECERTYLPAMSTQASTPSTAQALLAPSLPSGPLPALTDAPAATAMRCCNLEILAGGSRVRAAGRPLDLTTREFQVLLALAQRRNRVVPRGDLYELVWQRRMAYRDRSVDVFVRKLRLKLREASPEWVYIHTHFGVGYRFAPERVV
jgi:DNA-binding response OmpR family regulator